MADHRAPDTIRKTGEDAAPRSLLGGLARKMMAGTIALSVGLMGLPALTTTAAQADGYYGPGYYGGYGYAPRHRAYGYYGAPPRYYRPHGPRPHPAHRARMHHRHHHHHGKDDARAAVAGAVIGLAIGSIIANEANRHHKESNRYRSYATPPQHHPRGHAYSKAPQVAHKWDVAPEPFTDEWYAYCHDKYRSFDPDTGTFQPYQGPRKLCR